MALIDVSEVLTDPDFADQLVVERSIETVTDGGLASITPSQKRITGVVTNPDGDRLKRKAEGEIVSGNILVHTIFKLRAGAPGVTADVLQWKGRRYTVTGLRDNSHFGRGFTVAECELIPLSG